jgi:hypothetical protein
MADGLCGRRSIFTGVDHSADGQRAVLTPNPID